MIVREAAGDADLAAVRRLILAHADARSEAPGVEQIRADAARLPGPYVPPHGGLWIAVEGDTVVGCVALQPLPSGVGEVKRMLVDAEWRGRGVGRALLGAAEVSARDAGASGMMIETQTNNVAACELYARAGYRITKVAPDAYPDVPGEVQVMWAKTFGPSFHPADER